MFNAPKLPYVYICVHKITKKFYVGYRCANKVNASLDFGIKYFTSSKYIKNNFDEFDFTIIAEFFNKEDAYEFEQELIYSFKGNKLNLNKMCIYNGKLINIRKFTDEEKIRQSIQATKWHSDPLKNKKHRESAKKTGLKFKKEKRFNGANNPMFGTKWTAERRSKCSNLNMCFWTDLKTNTRAYISPAGRKLVQRRSLSV